MPKKKSSALARLVDSIEIRHSDGTTTSVPVSAEDNITANKILASQMRALITKSIVQFGDLKLMTPKELKELTEAARNVAEFSGEVYKSGDDINESDEKRQDPETTDIPGVDFSKLKPAQKVEPPEDRKETPPETTGSA